MKNYYPPEFRVESFTCPHCDTKAHMIWGDVTFVRTGEAISDLEVCICIHCKRYSLWKDPSIVRSRSRESWKMIFPLIANSPLPNENMPDHIKSIYEEARQVEPHSKRAAAALLRLCTELLLKELGYHERLFNAIGSAAADGVPEPVIQGLDILRLYGNDAIHPVAEIKSDDSGELIPYLFELLNEIVEVTITRDEKRKALLSKLPDDKRREISERNAKAQLKRT